MAALLIGFGEWWLYIGLGVAAIFLTIGIDRIDEDARGAYIFRPLLIPGVMLIWPLVLWRWFKLETNSESWRKRYQPQRASHARLWLVFGIIIPVTFLAAMSFRQTPPADFEPQRLSEAGETAQ